MGYLLVAPVCFSYLHRMLLSAVADGSHGSFHRSYRSYWRYIETSPAGEYLRCSSRMGCFDRPMNILLVPNHLKLNRSDNHPPPSKLDIAADIESAV